MLPLEGETEIVVLAPLRVEEDETSQEGEIVDPSSREVEIHGEGHTNRTTIISPLHVSYCKGTIEYPTARRGRPNKHFKPHLLPTKAETKIMEVETPQVETDDNPRMGALKFLFVLHKKVGESKEPLERAHVRGRIGEPQIDKEHHG